MTKSRKIHRSKKSFLRNIRNTTARALRVVENGLNTVGTTVEKVAVNSAPIVNKGLAKVYGTMATGFDMGIKGVKKGVTIITERRKSHKRSRKSRKSRKY